ncbi:MAG: hypothetical protein RLY67_916 [Pseudomonadota bacterium]
MTPWALGPIGRHAFVSAAVLAGVASAWLNQPAMPWLEPLLATLLALPAALFSWLGLRYASDRWATFCRMPRLARGLAQLTWPLVTVLTVDALISQTLHQTGVALGLALGLAMTGYLPESMPTPPARWIRSSAISVYVASLLAPLAALYNWMPASAVWASVAAVLAFQARRIALLSDPEFQESALVLQRAAVTVYLWVLLCAVLVAAIFQARGQLQI